MNIQQSILRLVTEPPLDAYGNSLRGYISHQFPQYAILHNHREDGRFLYLYPRVQYRVISGEGLVIGIEEGVSLIQTLGPHMKEIQLKGNTYRIIRKQVILEEVKFGFNESMIFYSFLNPWLALNEKNYSEYMKCGSQGRRYSFLKSILTGNLLSMAKSLGCIVEHEVRVDYLAVEEKETYLKGVPMLGFVGSFSVNFRIPDLWGVGKSVSRGFGTILKTGQEGS